MGGYEGNEDHEGSSITSKVSAGIACKIRSCIASKVCARVTCKVSCSVTSKVSSSFALQIIEVCLCQVSMDSGKVSPAFTRQDSDQRQVWGFPQLWSAASIRVWQLQ